MWGFRGFCLGSRMFLGPWGPFFFGGGGKTGARSRPRDNGEWEERERQERKEGGGEGKDGRGGKRKGKPPAILGIAGGFCCLWG